MGVDLTGATGAGVGIEAFGVGGTPPFGAPAIGLPTGADEEFEGAEKFPAIMLFFLKYSIQAGSTELGSFWKASNISSASHSLAPRSPLVTGLILPKFYIVKKSGVENVQFSTNLTYRLMSLTAFAVNK